MPSFETRLAAAVLLAACALTASAETPKAPLHGTALAGALHERLQALAAQGEFSGAVLLAKGDRVLLREAVGDASREARVPNTPATRFNLGSINKAFTRVAIEQLAAAGKLKTSDTLDRYVPEYPVEKGRRVTIDQLLEHRGGTGDFFGPKYDAYDHSRLRTLRDWLPLVTEGPLLFEPGTEERYSNAGYLLLGLVIERVSGQAYDEYMREHVFEPAGMKDTGFLEAGSPGLATGYTREGGGALADNRRFLPARGTSAGGGYSTLDDLLRFAGFLRGRLGRERGGIGVAGGAPGVNAVLEMEGDETLVVLANLDPPAAQAIASQVRAWRGDADEGPGPGRRIIRREAGRAPEKPEATELPDGAVSVPMLESGHLPAVQVMLDGQGPFLFAIDTGGAGTLRVDQALAERMHLPRVGEARAGDPSGRNTQTVPLVSVKSVQVGGARFLGLRASVRDFALLPAGEKVDGILGFGLFADCLLTLDYPGKAVRLERGELAADGPSVIPFRSPRGVPSVTLRVAGKEMEADLDAGSMGGITLPESAAAGLPLSAPLAVVGHARTASNAFEIKAAPLDGDVTLAGLTLAHPTIEFQPIFPMANVGARVLEGLVVTFDQKHGLVRLARPGSPG